MGLRRRAGTRHPGSEGKEQRSGGRGQCACGHLQRRRALGDTSIFSVRIDIFCSCTLSERPPASLLILAPGSYFFPKAPADCHKTILRACTRRVHGRAFEARFYWQVNKSLARDVRACVS